VVPASHANLVGERPSGRLAALGRVTGKTLRMTVGN
jgi:hypothetical protein